MQDKNLEQIGQISANRGQRAETGFQLISVAELARILMVPPVTVYSWKRRGKTPYVQLERCIRFDWAEIQKWLQNRKREVLSSDP